MPCKLVVQGVTTDKYAVSNLTRLIMLIKKQYYIIKYEKLYVHVFMWFVLAATV